MDGYQESFWQGDFGDDYVVRNDSKKRIASNAAFFSQAIRNKSNINSILELGCNIGMNLMALNFLLPSVSLNAIEINEKAIEVLNKRGEVNVVHGSLISKRLDEKFDLTFTKGVLIHISPKDLEKAYESLYFHSSRYILVAEYYNSTPVSIPYRGVDDVLFKRDFAGELMDKYSGLRLVDYGFVYHRDEYFDQDDMTWFLLEKGKVHEV